MDNDDKEDKRGSTVCSQRTVGGPPEGRGGAARRAVRSLRTCDVSEERKIKDIGPCRVATPCRHQKTKSRLR